MQAGVEFRNPEHRRIGRTYSDVPDRIVFACLAQRYRRTGTCNELRFAAPSESTPFLYLVEQGLCPGNQARACEFQ